MKPIAGCWLRVLVHISSGIMLWSWGCRVAPGMTVRAKKRTTCARVLMRSSPRPAQTNSRKIRWKRSWMRLGCGDDHAKGLRTHILNLWGSAPARLPYRETHFPGIFPARRSGWDRKKGRPRFFGRPSLSLSARLSRPVQDPRRRMRFLLLRSLVRLNRGPSFRRSTERTPYGWCLRQHRPGWSRP